MSVLQEAVVGHRFIISKLEQLSKTINRGFFIFHGPFGIGKSLVAETWLRSLEPSELEIVRPSNIKIPYSVSSIESILTKTMLIPSCAMGNNISPDSRALRCIMIDTAELLKPTLCNALLKITEELPNNNIIVLIVTDLSNIPITLRSRAIKIGFHPLAVQEKAQILSTQGIQNPSMVPVSNSISVYQCFALGFDEHLCRLLMVMKSPNAFIEWAQTAEDIVEKLINTTIHPVPLWSELLYEIAIYLCKAIMISVNQGVYNYEDGLCSIQMMSGRLIETRSLLFGSQITSFREAIEYMLYDQICD